jgi:transposase-like protein
MPRTTSQKKLQLWTARFEQFQLCHQNVQQFCESLGCTPATFRYWKRKLETASGSTRSQAEASAFVPVVLRGSSSSPVIVRVKDGTRIAVPVDALSTLEIILQHAQRVAR